MIDFPVRLLSVSYGLAAIGAFAAAAAGLSATGAALLFWLGGAALAVALGVLPATRDAMAMRRDAAGAEEDAALAASIAAWEAERLEASREAEAQDRRRA